MLMSEKLQKFYKSRKWESFIKKLRAERVDESGFIICEHCKKPILKAYDCIGHHKRELTDDNVNDVMISLNPENVALVHFKCHNEIHKRFGNSVCKVQDVFIVYGAPCSGKTTWVKENAESEDLILDIDRLWQAVRADRCGRYDKPSELSQNVFAMRDLLIDMIKVRRGNWQRAFIIGGYPLQGERERLADIVGAKQLVFIDTPKEVCEARLRASPDGRDQAQWQRFIDLWFERYSPPV